MIWLLPALAGPNTSLFEPVTTDLGGGAQVNWSAARLEITASSRRSGSEGTRAVEELARRAVDLQVTAAALEIPIAPGKTLRDLRKVGEIWTSLEPRIGRWAETENRYGSSGEVTIVGALSLVELMKPVTMATATSNQSEETSRTGATLDARGHEVEPCFAPRIMGPDGPLYEGRMWLDAAVERPPAVWVSDAAAPAASRSGANPMLAAVTHVEGCVLTLGATAAAEMAELVAKGKLGEGSLVIVVDR